MDPGSFLRTPLLVDRPINDLFAAYLSSLNIEVNETYREY